MLMLGAANALERTTNERDDLKHRIATLENDNRMLADEVQGLEVELSSFRSTAEMKDRSSPDVEAGATLAEAADNWERAGFADVAREIRNSLSTAEAHSRSERSECS